MSKEPNVPQLLKEAARELCRFLQTELPADGKAEWWQKRVIDQLSYQQQKSVLQRHIKRLQGLDFSALLRILDRKF